MPTQAIPLGENWQEVGQGPALVETKRGNNVRVHFGNAAPAPDTKAYHDMFDAASIGYGGTERIYARSHNGQPSIIVTPAGGEHEP